MYQNSGTYMKRISRIAYRGEKFTIEWYFDAKDKSHVLDYFLELDEDRQDKFLYLLKRMGDMGQIKDKTKFRNEEDGIYAFKPKPDRFLCFFVIGRRIILSNAFEKRQDKLPKSEKEKALKIKEDYQMRVNQEAYYE